jgi:hypothetical protein
MAARTAKFAFVPAGSPASPRRRVRRCLLAALVAGGLFFGLGGSARAGKDAPPEPEPEVAWSRWEFAQETAVTFGVNNPNDYVVAPQIFTLRWQPTAPEQFFHTSFIMSRQFTLSAIAAPFLHGPENHYFGGGIGVRQTWTRPGSRFFLYIDGRFMMGAVDSSGPPYGQGQDFAFSALVGGGLMYQVAPRVRVGLGVLYEHFSNGGLSEPEVENIGLDTVGPNLSVNVAF